MNRRSFFGWLGGVAAFPVDWVRGLLTEKVDLGWVTWAPIDSKPPDGWKFLRQRCGGHHCEARYRWVDRETVQVDWWRTWYRRGEPYSPWPRLVADSVTKEVRFEPQP